MRYLIAVIFCCLLSTATAAETGIASYYCEGFSGKKTASGETYNCGAMTTAHMTLPFGTMLRVTNKSTGKSIVVRVNDRGDFAKLGRVLDMSRAAFAAIANLGAGVVRVKVERVK